MDKKKSGRPKGFVGETAEETGMSKRNIQLALERAEKIPPDVQDMMMHTHLNKGAYLDSIKNLSHEDQRAKVMDDLIAGPSRRARRTKLEMLKDLWLETDDDERAAFLRWID